MGLSPRDPDALGVWALDAADADELDAIDAAIAEDPALAGEASLLRSIVAHLAEPLADTPPGDVRDAVIAAAAAARPVGSSAALPGGGRPPLEVFAGAVERLAATIDQLDADAWDRPALPYRWTVHGLVAHLTAVERYAGSLLGVPGAAPPVDDTDDHIAFAEPFIAEALGTDPRRVAAAWRAAAHVTVDHVRSGAVDLDADVVVHGIPMSARSLLVVRSFELWTHDDDIRRATGRPVADPPTADVRTMSETAVEGLPGLLLLTDRADVSGRAHVVLTGPGGGTWDIAFGPDAEWADEVTLVADAVDWCRLASSRLTPAELDLTIEGNPRLLGPLLVAAQALAF